MIAFNMERAVSLADKPEVLKVFLSAETDFLNKDLHVWIDVLKLIIRN